MKSYPNIPASTGQSFTEFRAHVFDKLDGSNLRFEWSKKQSWHKFGTRARLFDETDPDFGEAKSLFIEDYSPIIDKIIEKNGWKHIVLFMEFLGKNSFAGVHNKSEKKRLVAFDASVDKKGLISPVEFIKNFSGEVETPKYLGEKMWTRGFVDNVRAGLIEGITFEGCVGKMKSGNRIIMSKAKTQAWIDAVVAHYGEKEAKKLI